MKNTGINNKSKKVYDQSMPTISIFSFATHSILSPMSLNLSFLIFHVLCFISIDYFFINGVSLSYA